MRRIIFCSLFAALLVVLALTTSALWAQAAPPAADELISLPPPATSGGMALTEALAHRRSIRSFTATPLTQQELSQLLWAAQGITDANGHRTAPSARAQYYLKVYAATPDGVFEYIPQGHKLRKISGTDVRNRLSSEPQEHGAAVVLIIAGDYARAEKDASSEKVGARFVSLEAGHCAQNVLLQATALGLGAFPLGGIEPGKIQGTEPPPSGGYLSGRMGHGSGTGGTEAAVPLPEGYFPIYLIPVGHPK